MIIADSRETRGTLLEAIKRQHVTTEVVQLEVGDYVISGPTLSVCLTSKSAEDYVASIGTEHLNEELYQITANYDYSVLMIFGDINHALRHRKMQRRTVSEFLAGCTIERAQLGRQGSISVISFANVWDAALYVKTLHNKIVSDDIYREPTAKKVKMTKGQERLYSTKYLLKPCGVGFKRAEGILERFGSIKNLVNASVEDLKVIDGIGDVIANKIYQHVNEGD